MMAVAIAGPGSNVLLAGIGAVLLGLLFGSYQDAQAPSLFARFLALNLFNFITINVFLALFNLLPIPPFDGSHIVEGLLPEKAAAQYERLRPMGFPIMLLLIVGLPWLIPGFDPIGKLVVPPVEWLTGHYLALAAGLAGG
jgi:Zn-dependent protease